MEGEDERILKPRNENQDEDCVPEEEENVVPEEEEEEDGVLEEEEGGVPEEDEYGDLLACRNCCIPPSFQ